MSVCNGANTIKAFKNCLKNNHDLTKWWGYFGEGNGDPTLWTTVERKRYYGDFVKLLEDEYDVKNNRSSGSFKKSYPLIHSFWHCRNEFGEEFCKYIGKSIELMRLILSQKDDELINARVKLSLKSTYDNQEEDEKRSMALGGFNEEKLIGFLVTAANTVYIDGKSIYRYLNYACESVKNHWYDKVKSSYNQAGMSCSKDKAIKECNFNSSDVDLIEYRLYLMLFASKTGQKFLKYLGEKLIEECEVWRIDCLAQLTQDYVEINKKARGI